MPGWVLVALGSAIGGVARFGVSVIGVRWLGPGFPWATLAVNILGSGFIGWLAASLPLQPPSARLFWMTGVCGGFTTFSAFAFENIELLLDKNYATFAAYSIASFVVCLGATFVGLILTRS